MDNDKREDEVGWMKQGGDVAADGAVLVTQILGSLPGHLTTAAVILYIMIVWLPQRDAQHAAAFAEQQKAWTQTIKEQREDFLASEKLTRENYGQQISEARNLCYGTITENQRLLKEILGKVGGKGG